MAELLAALTDDDDRALRDRWRPLADGAVAAPFAGRNETGIAREIVVDPHVEQQRALRGADKPLQLANRDRV